MRWSDEPWRKLYTRNTVNWRLLPWQARCLLPLLVREVDEAGLMHVGPNPNKAVAAALNLPYDLVRDGLRGLTTPGDLDPNPPVVVTGGVLVLRNFVEAQEARTSDKVRKQHERRRERDKYAQSGESLSHDVTGCHAPSRREEKRREEILNEQPPSGVAGVLFETPGTTRFDLLAVYALYPRKRGKSAGLKKLNRDIRTAADYEQLKRAVERYRAEVSGKDQQYVQYFSTWCGSWRDWTEPTDEVAPGSDRPLSDFDRRLLEKDEAWTRGGGQP